MSNLQKNDLNAALMPCPFCGGKAVFDHDDNGWNWIECTACGTSSNARVSAMDDCKPLLLEQWNRRQSSDQMALAYYKAAMLKKAPPFVPATVRVLELTFGDGPFKGAGVEQGDHECQCNQWGAVAVFDRAGKPLGLRPNEFEPLTWRANEKAQNDGIKRAALAAPLE